MCLEKIGGAIFDSNFSWLFPQQIIQRSLYASPMRKKLEKSLPRTTKENSHFLVFLDDDPGKS